ncbi:MAG: type IV secretory system conjugative DNA transfer family protein [Firmicutes bacterium]|nr:type IV secretory system conjugative DNA transfer family protein [Bacillota bacterium]
MKSKWNKQLEKILLAVLILTALSYACGFVFNSLVINNFSFRFSIWLLAHRDTFIYTGLFMGVSILIYAIYYYNHYWLKATNRIIKGHKRDSDIETNLEDAKFQTDEEIRKNFNHSDFESLSKRNISGVPIRAVQGRTYDIDFAGFAHVLIIGTTGSGKTTAYINPVIQILAESASKASMLISDPKGELYQLHAKSLMDRGYDVKVLDLRNPFHSIKWNPLERAYLNHQRMLRLETEVKVNEETGGMMFNGEEYYDIKKLENAIGVKRQEIGDTVYEDLHDIATVLCPIQNKQEPLWESGAKNFILAIALAMLEDSENPDLGMTKERYNFYNLKAIATNTENDCEELLKYFLGRPDTSRARSLSKQVIGSSDKTRNSYLSTLFDKLNLFADLSLCSLTSENDIDFTSLADKPTALFLQIPDERETRHPLAAMVILQAYKELVRVANEKQDLTLPRPVYFLLDEFGQLPPIPKLEQMITVGRSRNIWLHLVIQSYAQLAKVYDEKVSEIIKSNTNIQVFIGSTDQKTIEEFSKRCGNFSVITRNVGYNTIKASDINSNASIKERPLIYPSELQKLNSPTDMGNAIVTVFGFDPIRSKFTPSFKCTSLKMEKTTQKLHEGKFFDETKVYYDMKKRNSVIIPYESNGGTNGNVPNPVSDKEMDLFIEHYKNLAEAATEGLIDDSGYAKLMSYLDNRQYVEAIGVIDEARAIANGFKNYYLIELLSDLSEKLIKLQQADKTGRTHEIISKHLQGENFSEKN